MASPVDTTVKHYRNVFPGAPVLNGQVGSLTTLIDAIKNGFGERSVTSAVVSGGVCTLTLASEALNVNLLYSVILVAGVTGAMTDLNGEQRVTAATLTTLQFLTDLADGTATGTITMKTAPYGLTTDYSGTNKRIYSFSSPEASLGFLRLEDNNDTAVGTNGARVRMFDAMGDIDTGVNPTPTNAQVNNGAYWMKSSAATADARRWTVVGDHCAFHLFFGTSGLTDSTAGHFGGFFGDALSHRSGDPYLKLLVGGTAFSPNIATTLSFNNSSAVTSWVPRASSFTGGSTVAYRNVLGTATDSQSGLSNAYGTYPSPGTDGLFITPVAVSVAAAAATSGTRGVMPGVYHAPQNGLLVSRVPNGTVLDGTGPLAGKKLLVIGSSSPSSAAASCGVGLVDITGPWR